MKQLLKLVFVFLPLFSFAQKDSNQKPFSSKGASHKRDSLNNMHMGEQYVTFFLNANNGENFTNESVKGKVLFVAFFCENFGCWNNKELNNFYDSMKDEPDFKFVAVAIEGDGLQEFIEKEHIDFPIARVRSATEAKMLNYGNGFPSFVVLDKEGKVAMLKNSRLGTKNDLLTTDVLNACNYVTDEIIKQE